MKNILLILGIASLTGCYQYNKDITTEELQTNISYLASDSLKGRMTGTNDIRLAADFIVKEFEKIGLIPLGDSSGYLKYYPFISSAEIDPSTFLKTESNNLTTNTDFIPLAFSASQSAEKLPVAFVGYAATVPEKKYDDFGKVDVKGKVVIAFRGIPENGNPHSAFANSSSLRSKARLAQQAGAKAIIFVNTIDDSTDELIKFDYDRAAAQGIAAFSVKRSIVDGWLKMSNKPDLSTLESQITNSLKSFTFDLSKINLSFNVAIKYNEAPAYNVIGMLPGTDTSLAKEYVVIGAHYDHWGMGGNGSLYRGTEPQIHNGADDNASGTAGVIEIAQALAGAKNQPKRSVIFALFSGEELGLLGSKALADNFPVPIQNVTTMVNFDMIGRMDSTKKLIIHGMGSSPEFKPLLDSLNKTYQFKIAFKDDGFGPSDHSSFYAKDIPVIFFFTDLHSDYHRPTDDADKIQYQHEADLLNYALTAIETVVNQPVKPKFTKVQTSSMGRSMAFRVSLGTIPDYGSEGGGMKITGVNPGSPAEKAGLKSGDVIVKIGAEVINNVYDYTAVLGSLSAGKAIDLVYKRNGTEIKTSITPAKRN